MSEQNPPTVPADNVAKPGPHPHESEDFGKWAGVTDTGQRTGGLPEGVEPFQGEGAEPEDEPGTV